MKKKSRRLKRGQKHERLVLGLLRSLRLPWISKTRLATHEEDAQGGDVIIEDIWGQTMFLQVKSSPKEAQLFRKKRREQNKPYIVAIVVDAEKYSPKENLARIKEKFRWTPMER
jgi:hypothetical protein